MDTSYSAYDFENSADRIDEILNTPDVNYEETNSVPSRDRLTVNNGFYVNCSSMFVDIRGSKELAGKYKRSTLARIYRSYISELVAVMRYHTKVCEVSIQGDCVWGVFDTPQKADVDELFSIAYTTSSMIDILNWKLGNKKIDPLTVGIGLSYGRALMIKAGHKGSSINDVVWMGDVVNEAAKLCDYGNSTYSDREIMLSEAIYINLNEHNRSLLGWNAIRQCYHGDVISLAMDKWLKEQQAK
jgi:class 3 adenylate cyclase